MAQFFQKRHECSGVFFVLSGFLITYLLLKESHTTGNINVKLFYFKRILRIWPLYFLLVFIGLFLLPFSLNVLHINYTMPYSFSEVWYYFLFFVPGLATFYFGHHFLEPLWSIGVEEVFYLVWAPVFKFSNDKIIKTLYLVIFAKIILLVLAKFYIKNELLDYLASTFQFEAMAIGGLGAYYVFHKGNLITRSFLYHKYVQIIVYSVLAVYLLIHFNINNIIWDAIFKTPILSSVLIDILFLYLIIGVSLVENSLIKLNYKATEFLGGISYGIYMYHMLVLSVITLLLKKHLLNIHPAVSFLFFYTTTIGLIVITSVVSKKTIENYFLNFRK